MNGGVAGLDFLTTTKLLRRPNERGTRTASKVNKAVSPHNPLAVRLYLDIGTYQDQRSSAEDMISLILPSSTFVCLASRPQKRFHATIRRAATEVRWAFPFFQHTALPFAPLPLKTNSNDAVGEKECGGALCRGCHAKFCAREIHDASLSRCSLPKHAPPSCTASRSAPHARSRAYTCAAVARTAPRGG